MVINMIYDHLVKHNGKYYRPGEEVPDNKEPLLSEAIPGLSDDDISFETDSLIGAKSVGRRGRPKKSD